MPSGDSKDTKTSSRDKESLDRHRRSSPSSHKKKRSRSRSRSRSRERRRNRDKRRSRSRSRDRHSRRKSVEREKREPSPELTPEQRDERTVFVWQLSNRVRERDLEQFFTQAGKVRCAKIIYDNKTGRAKGIAYIEFRDKASVSSALNMNGQKLLGVPIQIQSTYAERMRIGNYPLPTPYKKKSMNLYVGSLHYNITEDMLRGIFEPFGRIESVKIIREPVTMRSQGYGFVVFAEEEEGLKALEQLNGFEIAGRPMKDRCGSVFSYIM